MGRDLHAMSLHYVMFLPTVQGQTDEQQVTVYTLNYEVFKAILKN